MRADVEAKAPIIDLLYPSEEKRKAMKRRRIDVEQLPTGFANDLILEKLADIMCREYQYKMLEIFKELSDDEEVIAYRQDILDDLIGNPEVAAGINKLIKIMLTNDKTNLYDLNTPDSFTSLDAAISGFEAYTECVELMHKLWLSKKDAINSVGLKRMFAFFENNYSDKDYVKLREEVTELRNAVNGKIRCVTVAINLNENLVPIEAGVIGWSDKVCESKPTVIDRIASFGVKGENPKALHNLRTKYTGENEPNSQNGVLNMTDKLLFEELDFVVKKYVKAIDSILKKYRAIGFEDIHIIEYQLDFYMSAVRMIENARSKGLQMCRPVILAASERKAEIKGLFDPIYFNEANIYNLRNKDKKSVITNDISLDDTAGFYVLTGANNGGKTTFVRSVGICQVLAQAGLYVPAESCTISMVDCIYTHFPKEEQVGIDASRFTTEIKEFKAISDTITDRSLLLMNESIQSTTPQECIDIAGQLVRIFCVIGVRGLFATHLTDMAKKAVGYNDDPLVRTKTESLIATVNEENGERLYKIVKGYPSETGYAGAVFEKFGLDIKAIEKRAARK